VKINHGAKTKLAAKSKAETKSKTKSKRSQNDA